MTTSRTSAVRKGRLAGLTRAYPHLQGYAALPLLLIPLALMLIDGGRITGAWTWLIMLGSVLVASCASRLIRRWYEQSFGLVQPTGGRGWRLFLTYFALLMVGNVLVPALLIRFAGAPSTLFDSDAYAWGYAVLGVLVSGHAFVLRPYLQFNAVFGALMAALALVPLGQILGLPEGVHPFHGVGMLAFLGAGLVGYAFTAHATLVRELRRIRSELVECLPASGAANTGLPEEDDERA